jgi:hypothetical protein
VTRLPFELTRIAAVVWFVYAPLLFVGALLSQMETVERYFLQLGVFTLIAMFGVVAGVKAFSNRPWSRITLLGLSWISALFWFLSALDTALIGDLMPLLFGLVFLLLVALLHMIEPRPTTGEQ